MSRRIGFGIVAAAVLVMLGGCAVQAPSSPSDAEARERFVALLDETQSVVGGDWSVRDDPTPRECIVPLWVVGERFPALRLADAPFSIELTADRVESAWEAHELTVTRTEIGHVVEVQGESADGEILLFRVSRNAMTLTGESECRPVA